MYILIFDHSDELRIPVLSQYDNKILYIYMFECV